MQARNELSFHSDFLMTKNVEGRSAINVLKGFKKTFVHNAPHTSCARLTIRHVDHAWHLVCNIHHVYHSIHAQVARV